MKRRANPPRKSRHDLRPLTAQQIAAFLSATRDDRLGPLYAVAIGLGLRKARRWPCDGPTWTSTADSCRFATRSDVEIVTRRAQDPPRPTNPAAPGPGPGRVP